MKKDLITLEEYKSYYSLSKSENDPKLSMLITAVSNLIKAYTNNSISDNYNDPIVESFSLDYDTNTIYPSQWPIVDVLSVTETDRTVYDSTIHLTLDPQIDFRYDQDRIFRTSTGSLWSVGPNSIVVTYTAGYEDTPEDLKLAAMFLVDYYNSESFKESRSLRDNSIITTPLKGPELPMYIRAILDNYKIQ